MDLKLRLGFNHLEGIYLDEKNSILLAEKNRRRERI
jgi:hypothetical protein